MKKMLIVGFLIGVILISSCSKQKTQVQPTSSPNTGAFGIKKDVAISGFAFKPSELNVPKGASVVWTNMDSAPHTIVSDSGDEIKSGSISKGENYENTFNTIGAYNYHCGIHPSMKGKIVVN